MSGKQYLRAKADLIPTDGTHLLLHKGDIIQVVKLLDTGWCLGINESTKEKGWFPKSYGKPYSKDKEKRKSTRSYADVEKATIRLKMREEVERNAILKQGVEKMRQELADTKKQMTGLRGDTAGSLEASKREELSKEKMATTRAKENKLEIYEEIKRIKAEMQMMDQKSLALRSLQEKNRRIQEFIDMSKPRLVELKGLRSKEAEQASYKETSEEKLELFKKRTAMHVQMMKEKHDVDKQALEAKIKKESNRLETLLSEYNEERQEMRKFMEKLQDQLESKSEESKRAAKELRKVKEHIQDRELEIEQRKQRNKEEEAVRAAVREEQAAADEENGRRSSKQRKKGKLERKSSNVRNTVKGVKIDVFAKYDFVGTRKEQLSFAKGEEIVVTKMNSSGWFFGTSQSTEKSGWFPNNYIFPPGTKNPNEKLKRRDSKKSLKSPRKEPTETNSNEASKESSVESSPRMNNSPGISRDKKTELRRKSSIMNLSELESELEDFTKFMQDRK